MRPGDIVKIIKGKHEGRTGVIRGSETYYYHVQLLPVVAGKETERESFHRSEVKPDV